MEKYFVFLVEVVVVVVSEEEDMVGYGKVFFVGVVGCGSYGTRVVYGMIIYIMVFVCGIVAQNKQAKQAAFWQSKYVHVDRTAVPRAKSYGTRNNNFMNIWAWMKPAMKGIQKIHYFY